MSRKILSVNNVVSEVCGTLSQLRQVHQHEVWAGSTRFDTFTGWLGRLWHVSASFRNSEAVSACNRFVFEIRGNKVTHLK